MLSAVDDERTIYNVRVVVMGDASVGKTTFINRIARVYSDHDDQVGVAEPVVWRWHNSITGDHIATTLYDTAGSEDEFNQDAIAAICRNAHGAVIFYDVNKYSSLENAINVWYKLFRSAVPERCENVIFIGTKLDLAEHGTDTQTLLDTLSNIKTMINLKMSGLKDTLDVLEGGLIQLIARLSLDPIRDRPLLNARNELKWRFRKAGVVPLDNDSNDDDLQIMNIEATPQYCCCTHQ